MMKVDLELCTGCGNCVAVCPDQAISLNRDKAFIDEQTCTQCEACIDACPTGAISAVETVPVPVVLEPELVVYEGEPAGASGLARFAPVVGSTLAYLGREFGPRLADVLFNVVEHRLTNSTTVRSPTINPSAPPTDRNRPVRRRQRRRGLR